ncbi:MAG: OB-fold domain-containing protein [Hyphomicrobiaceae bacterium]
MSETTSDMPPEFAGFFDHARTGKLAFPHCRACGTFHWYPMPLCPHCRSRDVGWQTIAGAGEIYAFTRVMHAFDKARAGDLPYYVAIVTFPDAPGVRFVTNIEGHADTVQIGKPVRPVFEVGSNGLPIVKFGAA